MPVGVIFLLVYDFLVHNIAHIACINEELVFTHEITFVKSPLLFINTLACGSERLLLQYTMRALYIAMICASIFSDVVYFAS